MISFDDPFVGEPRRTENGCLPKRDENVPEWEIDF